MKQKLERHLRWRRRDLMRDQEFKTKLVRDYNDGNLFYTFNYLHILKTMDLKVKDIYNIFQEHGYQFVKDTESDKKRYFRLKHIVAELKLAQQLHAHGVVEALWNFGYDIGPNPSRDDIVSYDHADPIPLNYKTYELEHQNCKTCHSTNMLNQKFGIKFSGRKSF